MEMIVASDNNVNIYTKCDSGKIANTNKFIFTSDGFLSFPNSNSGPKVGILINQSSSSNYNTAVTWYKGGTSKSTYDPQIGQYNIGGNSSSGSITILPYATTTSPWGGTVGLFVEKGGIRVEGGTGEVKAGKITTSLSTSTHINGNKGVAIINSTAAGNSYNMLCRMKSKNGVWTMGNYNQAFHLYYTSDTKITAGTNATDKDVVLIDELGYSYFNTIYEGGALLSGKYAAKNHTHEYISNSDGKCKLYFNNNNEVNFGGSYTRTDIYIGFRATDSRPKPSTFYLGQAQAIDFGSNGSLTVGTADLCCDRVYCKTLLAPSIVIDGESFNRTSIAWRYADTATNVRDLSWVSNEIGQRTAPTISTLAYWNGRYTVNASNLRYCWGGQMTYSPDGGITCFRAGSTYLEVTAYGVAYGCNWWQSDTKLKTNIEETNVNDALAKLSSIDFIQYDWKESYIKDRPHIKLGLSANQVETIIPEAVMNIEQPEENEYDVIKQLDSTVLITYSMKAIVELNNKLNDKVEKLEKRIKELETAKN